MPERAIVTHELARFLSVLAHPQRVQIVEELRNSELDVNTLREILGTSASRVSQHLGLLRAHHIVNERREGRHHFYSLTRPELASWLLDGLRFIEANAQSAEKLRDVVAHVREIWTETPDGGTEPRR